MQREHDTETSSFPLGNVPATFTPEAPMALVNLQSLEMRGVELQDVGVTGPDCIGSQRTSGGFTAPILSLVRLPLPGPYPTKRPDAVSRGDNAAAAKAARTGRSAREAGELASAGTMLATWSGVSFASQHRECKAMEQAEAMRG
jgi:hypothetical protein